VTTVRAVHRSASSGDAVGDAVVDAVVDADGDAPRARAVGCSMVWKEQPRRTRPIEPRDTQCVECSCG
jgi:hypothetical protein